MTMSSQRSLFFCYFLVTLFSSLVSGRGVMRETDDAIRPTATKEGPDFWREYAKNDIDRKLRAVRNDGVAKNVIIFVGDGMGVQTVTMSRIYKGQKSGRNGEEEELVWESFPAMGLSKTYNVDHQVPDSAGTATAIFSGVKTNLGLVGVDHKVTRDTCEPEVYERSKLKGMMHWAIEAGKETGIVTNTRITHATPASAYAHSADRDWESDSSKGYRNRTGCNEDIARQLVHGETGKRLNVIFGGGRKSFLPTGDSNSPGGNRLSGNLVEDYGSVKKEGGQKHKYMETVQELRKWEEDGMTDYVMGLFALDHLKYMTDHNSTEESEPTLTEMAEAAVKRLQRSKNGFFLMVEGGRIDHAHHDNYAHRALDETREMEKAVRAVLKLVDVQETLIIITADHSHSVTMNGYPKRGTNILGHYFHDEYAMSAYKNGRNLTYATISYANGLGFYDHFTGDKEVPWKDFKDVEDVERADFRYPAMMPPPEKSETHGGEDVPIYAVGPMSHLLTGVHEQSFIGNVMAYAACVGHYRGDCGGGRTEGSTGGGAASSTNSMAMSSVVATLLLTYLVGRQ